jgi:hypothetical protein
VPSEVAPIRDQRCAGSSPIPSTAVSSAGSRAARPTWMSSGAGASIGTAARGDGSNGERVPRTGWRFVRHLNRLSALAFLRPVRKGSLGAEFPTPFRGPILRPGLPTPLPRAGRAEKYRSRRPALGDPSRGTRKERDFRSPRPTETAAHPLARSPRAEFANSRTRMLEGPPPVGETGRLARAGGHHVDPAPDSTPFNQHCILPVDHGQEARRSPMTHDQTCALTLARSHAFY